MTKQSQMQIKLINSRSHHKLIIILTIVWKQHFTYKVDNHTANRKETKASKIDSMILCFVRIG